MALDVLNENEICVSFKQAKNKNKQVGILANLNCTTPQVIRDILKKHDLIAAESEKPAKPKKKAAPSVGADIGGGLQKQQQK